MSFYLYADWEWVVHRDRIVDRTEIKHSGCWRMFKTSLQRGGAAPGRAPESWVIRTTKPTWTRHAAFLKVLCCSVKQENSTSMPKYIGVCLAQNWRRQRRSLNMRAAQARIVWLVGIFTHCSDLLDHLVDFQRQTQDYSTTAQFIFVQPVAKQTEKRKRYLWNTAAGFKPLADYVRAATVCICTVLHSL